jgi:heat shock protein HtpX
MFELIRANQRRTLILVFVMGLLLFFLGYAMGEIFWGGAGGIGVFIAFVIWVVMSLVSYFQGSRILLSISRARKIEKSDHPTLFNVVEEMTIASGLGKMPEIYIIDDPSPNAFAAGRDPAHAVVAVTSGLLELLTRDELQGVIAHELGHIRNRDVLYMTMVGVMLGAIVLIADLGRRHLFWGGATRSRRSSRDAGGAQVIMLVVAIVLIILAPIIARFIYLAVSRRREYLADASGASYTRYPSALASALEKIGSSSVKLRVANPATAPMYFVNPLQKAKKSMSAWGSTHPPTEERVQILRGMGGAIDLASYDSAFRTVTGRPVGVVPAGAAAAAAAEASKASPPRPPIPPFGMPGMEGMEIPGGKAAGAILAGAAAAGAAASAKPDHVARVRETTDALWKTEGYRFIHCPCGTVLKIPPKLATREITCPHCGTRHPGDSS